MKYKNFPSISSAKLNFSKFSELCKQLCLSSELFSQSQYNNIIFPKLETKDSEQIKFQITSKFCNCCINLYQIYSLLITKSFLSNQKKLYFPYNQEQLALCLKRLSTILSNYNDCLFYFELNQSDFFSKRYHHVDFISCHNDYSNNSKHKENNKNLYFKDKIETLYFEINQMNDKDYSPEIKNLYFLIHIFMIFGRINYNSPILETLMVNIDLYNALICTDLKIALLIHFHISMLISSVIKQFPAENITIFLSKKNNNLLMNNKGMEIPTIYYLSPKNKFKDFTEQYNFYFFQLQFQFKLYLIPILEEYFNLTFNLTLITFTLSLPQFDINQKQINIEGINLNDLWFGLNDLINVIQNSFTLNTFTVKIENNLQLDNIKGLIKSFANIILLSKNIYFESTNTKQNLEIEQMYSELTILHYILKYIKKIKHNFATYFFRFSYNTFRLIINKTEEGKLFKRDIILYISQELFNENKLLTHISKKNCIVDLYTEYKQIFELFQSFKKYTISIRLSKKEFINEELKFYFYLLYLQIQNLVQDNMILYDSDFISPKHTLVVNNITKQKDKIHVFNKSLKKLNVSYLQNLLRFYEKYFEYFNTVLVHNEINNNYPFNVKHILRNFNENELIIVNKLNYSIDLIIYLFEKETFNCIIEMIRDLRNDNLSKTIINKITIIIHKQKFQEVNCFVHNFIFYSQDVSGIYVVDNQTNIDCFFTVNKIRIISLNKITNYFISVTNAIYHNLNIIKYICVTQKKKLYDSLTIICGKKLFIFKNCIFTIKKISNKQFSSILETNIASSKDSYSLMSIILIEKNSFILNDLIELFEQNFINSKINIIDNNKLKELICNIIKSNSSKFKCVIYNQKYYDYMRKLLVNVNSNNKFKELIIIPIRKFNEFNLHQEEKITISKQLNLFKFINTKLNFFNVHDLALPLSPSRLLNTLDILYNKRNNSVTCTFENKFIKKVDIVILLLYILGKKYNCNYLERKEFSQSISKYIFKNECNVDVVGESEGDDSNFVQINNFDFELYAGEIHKYKKLKKIREKTKIQEKEEIDRIYNLKEEENKEDKREQHYKNNKKGMSKKKNKNEECVLF